MNHSRFSQEEGSVRPDWASRLYAPKDYDKNAREEAALEAERLRKETQPEIAAQIRKERERRASIHQVGAYLADQILARAALSQGKEAFFCRQERSPFGWLYSSHLDEAFQHASTLLKQYEWRVRYFRLGWWNRWLYSPPKPAVANVGTYLPVKAYWRVQIFAADQL